MGLPRRRRWSSRPANGPPACLCSSKSSRGCARLRAKRIRKRGRQHAGQDPHGREIPATLQGSCNGPPDRIEGETGEGQLAAVIGRETSYELPLAAVADMDEQVLQAERQFRQADILHQKGRPPGAPSSSSTPSKTPYTRWDKGKRGDSDSTSGSRRCWRVSADHPDAAGVLAHHFTEANLTEKAVDYRLKAGLRSRERSAESEAIGNLSRGLPLLETLDESPERDVRELEMVCASAPRTSRRRSIAGSTESAQSSRGQVSWASGWVSRRKYSPACLETAGFTSRAAIFGDARSCQSAA